MAAASEGESYRLPGGRISFKTTMYRHLVEWKRRYITDERGPVVTRNKKTGEVTVRLYDEVLPEKYRLKELSPHLYSGFANELKGYLDENKFRFHNHFYHMASSQAANINLFLPLLLHPNASTILQALNLDIATLATDVLYNGYCIEYWGGNFPKTGQIRGRRPAERSLRHRHRFRHRYCLSQPCGRIVPLADRAQADRARVYGVRRCQHHKQAPY